MHGSYLLKCALVVFPLAGLLGLNYLYLRNAGEFLPLSAIVREQRENPGFCIYGTALHDDTLAYKLEGYRQVQPDVIVAGSSLTMGYRARFFNSTFFSMSKTIDT